VVSPHEAQDKSVWAEHRTVYPVRSLRRKNRVIPAKSQKIPMESHHMGVLIPFRPVELACLKRPSFVRCPSQQGFIWRNAWKLCEKVGPSGGYQFCKLLMVIREIKERARGTELLSLKE
jgi:hypothetical protein